MERPRNDLSTQLVRFCLALEEFRRTAEGRVRTPTQFLQAFFPYDERGPEDKVFSFLPREIRGPIIAGWGIRGQKAALRDDDAKIAAVVYDALVAGDINAQHFEEGLGASTLVAWVPLGSWWSFWRAGTPHKAALLRALTLGYELGLFDARWFWETIELSGLADPNAKKRGTDVISAGLTKEDITDWIKRIHATGDGSPKGLLEAIGWDKVVQKTSNDSLAAVLDALAIKIELVKAPPKAEAKPEPNAAPKSSPDFVTSTAAPSAEEAKTPADPPPPEAPGEAEAASIDVVTETSPDDAETAVSTPAPDEGYVVMDSFPPMSGNEDVVHDGSWRAPSMPDETTSEAPIAEEPKRKSKKDEDDLAQTGPYATPAAATATPSSPPGKKMGPPPLPKVSPNDEDDGGDTMLYRSGKPVTRR
ncbi:hypothetical protein BH09MYX1_BH09MYX1_54620 [soil metagenome]